MLAGPPRLAGMVHEAQAGVARARPGPRRTAPWRVPRRRPGRCRRRRPRRTRAPAPACARPASTDCRREWSRITRHSIPAAAPAASPSSTASSGIARSPSRSPCEAAVNVTSAYRTPSAAWSSQNSRATPGEVRGGAQALPDRARCGRRTRGTRRTRTPPVAPPAGPGRGRAASTTAPCSRGGRAGGPSAGGPGHARPSAYELQELRRYVDWCHDRNPEPCTARGRRRGGRARRRGLLGPKPLHLEELTSGDEDLGDQVREVLGERGHHQVAAAVIDGGQTTYAGFGGADETTSFEIGSVAKALTGMLLSDLTEDGTVRLDQPVGELVPGTPLAGGKATLQELSQHRSGLPRLGGGVQVLRSGVAGITGGDPYTGTPDGRPGAGRRRRRARRRRPVVLQPRRRRPSATRSPSQAGKPYADLLRERVLRAARDGRHRRWSPPRASCPRAARRPPPRATAASHDPWIAARLGTGRRRRLVDRPRPHGAGRRRSSPAPRPARRPPSPRRTTATASGSASAGSPARSSGRDDHLAQRRRRRIHRLRRLRPRGRPRASCCSPPPPSPWTTPARSC